MRRIVLILLGCFFITACSEAPHESSDSQPASIEAADNAQQSKKKESAKYLAYVHNLSIEIERDKLASVHKKIIGECEKDTRFECAILIGDLRVGDRYQASSIQLRVKPEGVSYFSSLASQDGRVASQSRKAEDLSASIFDNAKRIEQLQRYQKKLEELEQREDADIDALLKVAAELASTQSQLELLQGSKAKLLKRVNTDILNINFNTLSDTSFYSPITESFSDFGEVLSEAIAGLINAIAYIVPWSLFLMFMFFIFRGLFRFLNDRVFSKKKQSND